MTQTVPDQERAERIADIRAFADWLEQNPWIPTPHHIDAAEHLNGHGQSAEEQRQHLATLEAVADHLGVKVEKRLNDRTAMTAKVGKFEYRLLVWHENGRPGQVDERDAELERLRAEVAALRSGVGLVDGTDRCEHPWHYMTVGDEPVKPTCPACNDQAYPVSESR